jgi:hypothetical protein
MEIRFISSLTSDDEDKVAPAIASALGAILDQLSIAYTLRIETSSSKVFQRSHPAMNEAAAARPTAPGTVLQTAGPDSVKF